MSNFPIDPDEVRARITRYREDEARLQILLDWLQDQMESLSIDLCRLERSRKAHEELLASLAES